MADLSGSISLHNHCDTPMKCPGRDADHTLYCFLQPESCFPSPGWLGLLEGRKERVVWLLQCLEASRVLWKLLQWYHLPRRGSLELTLGCSPAQKAVAQACGALRCGLGLRHCLGGKQQRSPVASLCLLQLVSWTLSQLLLCRCRYLPADPPRQSLHHQHWLCPCFQHMALSIPGFCPWALSHNWAMSWTSDCLLSPCWSRRFNLWLQTEFEIIFGKPLAVESDVALPGCGCALDCAHGWPANEVELAFFSAAAISGGHSIDCCASSALFPF